MRPASRRAFTLIEIMVTIVIVGGMAAFGAGIITPQISYFRSRRDAENLLEAIRKARALAMARGGTGNYGVTIFRGLLSTDRQSITPFTTSNDTPWCFVLFSDRDSVMENNLRDLGELSRPTLNTSLDSALTESEQASRISIRPAIVNLHEETTLHGKPFPGTQLPLSDNTVIQFDSKGRLMTGSGVVSSLIEETSGSSKAYSFDIKNPNMGFYRLRVRDNGTVELSALCETGTATPYSIDASGTQRNF
ncbi:MAG: type II secretion system protein [Candidatus Wallbacteria bacterium]|nr:type II secretion system protein [Candidatus Wallbacteria bacterium]